MSSGQRVPKRILMSGAGGLIGTALRRSFQAQGDIVVPMVRSSAGPGAILWNPERELDPTWVSGFDVAIHLAGEPVADGRWTTAKKQCIRESRVQGTKTFVAALRAAERPPNAFLCASGINFYGDHGSDPLPESTPAGDSFLSRVCVDWEAAAQGLGDVSRVVSLRIGAVLTPKGGALAAMLPIFRVGLAGPVAGGQQYLSWISLHDTVRAVLYLADNERIRGAVNLVSPGAVTARAFTKELASAVGKPARIPVPGWVARALLGKIADDTVLTSIRAVPRRLLESGFCFDDPELGHLLAQWSLKQR